MLWRSALRTDCTAVLGPRSRGRTHCAHFVRCVQTTAASQTTKRAARADLGPALLVAPEFARAGWRLPLRHRWGCCRKGKNVAARARAGRLECASGAPRSAGLVASRAARVVIRLVAACLNAANEVSEVSSATGHEPGAARGTAAKRRPLQRSAQACPHALLPRRPVHAAAFEPTTLNRQQPLSNRSPLRISRSASRATVGLSPTIRFFIHDSSKSVDRHDA